MGDLSVLKGEAAETVENLGVKGQYPFEHNFLRTELGYMHYVDEGEGDPILFLHGNPSWSFLWRRFLLKFAKTNRVVAPDYVGFGLSEKPDAEEHYTLDAHIRSVELLADELGLENITIVVQDWGGPIGLGLAARHPELIRAVVIINTFGFYPLTPDMDPENTPLPLPLKMMRKNGIGDFLVRKLGFFERVVMSMATASKEFKSVKHAYTDVFKGPEDRAGVMAFPRMIPGQSAHPSAQILIHETGPFIDSWKGPAHIFWGMKDPLFPVEALEAWKGRLPHAGVTELSAGKHYVQEDAPEEIINGLQTFMSDLK